MTDTLYTGKKLEMKNYFDTTPALKTAFAHPIWYLWYLGTQFKGWALPSYFLVVFTFAWNLEAVLANPTKVMIINSIGMILGVTCISAINGHKSVNGWLGILSAIFIIWSGILSKDFGAVLQQIAYIVALDIPVLLSKSWMGDKQVTHGIDKKGVAFAVISFVVGFAFMFAIVKYFGTPRIYQNSILFGVSFMSSILCLKKYRIQYLGWFATSLFAIWTWGSSFLQGDTTLVMLVGTLIYASNDIIAFTASSWYDVYPFNINYWRNKKAAKLAAEKDQVA